MFIVLEIENHPDRGIDDSYGPFDTHDEAKAFADDKYNCSFNLNAAYNHRLYNYRIMELSIPKWWQFNHE